MKKQHYLFLFISTFLFNLTNTEAQNIKVEKGYSPQIGTTVSMLKDLKKRVTNSVRNLDQTGTDFLIDENANRIGALILHLAATEAYYQVYTFQNRGFNRAESVKWDTALNLGDKAREELRGKPIQYYLDIWDDVREKTLKLLKTKDDKWFEKKIKGTSMNNHWAWYHVMEHQANHMGQIRFFIKRIPND
ncbi:MAG: DinB family protein [Bacteroidetes bacterium]|nr:DinB family protein [Bacteroidota bacterium]